MHGEGSQHFSGILLISLLQVTTLWYGDDRRYYTTTLADTVDSYNTTDVSKNFTGCTVFSCLEVSLFGDLYLDSGTCNITCKYVYMYNLCSLFPLI